jgi:hypothetical protein
VILVLLAKTVPQFTIGRDKCSTSGAQHRFVVVQYPRITESETSARRATELGSRVNASFDVVVEFDDLVDRHGVPLLQASASAKHRPRSSSYFEAGAPTADAIKDACLGILVTLSSNGRGAADQ